MANEQNLNALKKQRATIKASCTRTKSYVESIASLTPTVRAQLKERKVKLEQYWLDYAMVQSQIENLDESEANDRAKFEEAYYALAAKITELIDPPVSPTRGAGTSSPLTIGTFVASDTTNIRLPKLNLPKFTGKYDEWFPFFDAFNSIIHSNASLNNVQKLQYLRGCLSGEASDVVNSLEISELNYEVAWRLLKERYDNKRVIVHTHVKSIIELPSMTKENVSELRQIADDATNHIHALQALKRPTAHWDDLLTYIISFKLDSVTLREWQTTLTGSDLPTLKQLLDFIAHKCQVLEATGKSSINTRANSKRQSACHASIKYHCSYCNGDHSIYKCKDFLALPISRRNSEIRQRKLCVNCLRSTSHVASKCTSGACRVCKAKHNTLLHAETNSEPSNFGTNEKKGTLSVESPSAIVTHARSSSEGQVMLSTAVVYINDARGESREARVLLDCGSQANFVSRRFLALIGLKSRSLDLSISGINGVITKSSEVVTLQLQSRLNSYSATTDCIVTDQITDKLPAFGLKRNSYDIPHNLKLADPHFHKSSEIDILVGAEIFWDLLCVGQVKSSPGHPTLQKTHLGWILAGRASEFPKSRQRIRALHAKTSNPQLHRELERFWNQEDVSDTPVNRVAEEAYCEQHFVENVSQTPQGRFVVKLPVKEQLINKLGDSKEIALKRFLNLEKRFARDPKLKEQYTQFINEYQILGHMREINVLPDETSTSFYLPHHCVHKASKIRVVFDASCASSSGLTLNDVLMIGPVIQQDLMSILMRFRTFAYVFVADIIKMYRQIVIDPSHRRLQRILWRKDTDSNIKTYELTTVTYGTAPASYLATRCLQYLAELHTTRYPIGSRRIQRDFYMDDLLTGADRSVEEITLARDEIIKTLRAGAFELSKWASNLPDLLDSVNNQCDNPVTINDEANLRVLGIQWDQNKDTFSFTYESQNNFNIVSKRTILSSVARLFDPLGLLGPIIITAKLMLQELWQSIIQWDESVSQDLYSRWINFRTNLSGLSNLQVSRRVKFTADPGRVQVHGFCDASQRAYGAWIYIRTKMNENEYRVELLCSRSHVAPLKSITLPRLELCATVLLAQLMKKVADSINLTGVRVFLWSDSTIALNWITSACRRWSVFVSNRVGEVQRLTEPQNWRHVSSMNNPADVLSRGLEPNQLLAATLWWRGPAFLQANENQWPNSKFTSLGDSLPEKLVHSIAVATRQSSIIDDLLIKHSNLNKVCHILAYCLRFCKTYRLPNRSSFVSPDEVSHALDVACRIVQENSFHNEYKNLSNGSEINTSSRILSLFPFLDKAGLIRIGGRLKNSELQYNARHPILLPSDHELTKRLVYREHVRNMHAGTQATMAFVRQRFWPLSLLSVTRKLIQKCITCFRAKPIQSEAIMGVLSTGRVTVSRPFSHCGVDYAGPTKAVHIELVSDLTSDTFLAAFRRFLSRRGKPICMYSDNGTIFVGANKQCKELYDFINSEQTQTNIKEFLREHETTWSFIPPNAPYFGGLWEAAVKSAKYHMSRIVGQTHLTFEEITTVLYEIEAILNSRPLAPISNDPNDLAYLSLGHFLIGTALNSLPCRDLRDVSENRLTRWQRTSQIQQHFWNRWSSEYLHSLQERFKWKTDKGAQLKTGQLVVIKQPGLAPLQWLLGRIQEIHPGSDGAVRVATVKTPKGVFLRPLSKLAILPVDA